MYCECVIALCSLFVLLLNAYVFVFTELRYGQVVLFVRFGGSEFPPLIYFKIFNRTENGKGVTYLSGRKIIRPASIVCIFHNMKFCI